MLNHYFLHIFYAPTTNLYLLTTLKTLAHLLSKSSRSHLAIQEQLADFEYGAKILFKINYLKNAYVVFQVLDHRLYLLNEKERPLIDYDLAIVIKHPTLALRIFTFQESNTIAVANNRFLTHGDASLAIRFINCLELVEKHLLPQRIVKKALSRSDNISIKQRINFLKKIIT